MKFRITNHEIEGGSVTISVASLSSSKTKFYQTDDFKITIAIIENFDGSISIGFARAGKADIEARRITSEAGIEIAEGRALKAQRIKGPLIKKNYVRGIHIKEKS